MNSQAKYPEPAPCLCECPGWSPETVKCKTRSCVQIHEAAIRGYWNAIRDNYDGAPDMGGMYGCVGIGKSPNAAVESLLECEELHEDEEEEQS